METGRSESVRARILVVDDVDDNRMILRAR